MAGFLLESWSGKVLLPALAMYPYVILLPWLCTPCYPPSLHSPIPKHLIDWKINDNTLVSKNLSFTLGFVFQSYESQRTFSRFPLCIQLIGRRVLCFLPCAQLWWSGRSPPGRHPEHEQTKEAAALAGCLKTLTFDSKTLEYNQAGNSLHYLQGVM